MSFAVNQVSTGSQTEDVPKSPETGSSPGATSCDMSTVYKVKSILEAERRLRELENRPNPSADLTMKTREFAREIANKKSKIPNYEEIVKKYGGELPGQNLVVPASDTSNASTPAPALPDPKRALPDPKRSLPGRPQMRIQF